MSEFDQGQLPGGLGDLLKQARTMQEQLAKSQEEAANQILVGTAGGGMVTVEVTGGMQIVSVVIKKGVVDPDDVEMLQDLVIAATNNALAKARDHMASAYAKVTGGFSIPGLNFPG